MNQYIEISQMPWMLLFSKHNICIYVKYIEQAKYKYVTDSASTRLLRSLSFSSWIFSCFICISIDSHSAS